MIEIRLKDGTIATLDDDGWKADDRRMADLLNAHMKTVELWGSDPNPDLTCAEAAVKEFGGKITRIDQQIEHVPGRVY